MSDFKLGVSLAVDGEKEFKKAISDSNQLIKEMKSSLTATTSAFGSNRTTMDQNKQKLTELQKVQEAQKKKVDLLKSAVKDATQKYGENSKEASRWRTSLNQAQTELNKTTIELKKAEQPLNEYGSAQEKVADKTSKAVKSISSMSVAMGSLLASAIKSVARELTAFAKESITLASDLEEVKNVVDVTFGEGSSTIYSFAQTASSAFGITALQAETYAGRLGASLKAMGMNSNIIEDMSTSLAGLSGDLASFYNLESDEAYSKIFSAVIQGQTKGITELGVVMNEANLKTFAMQNGYKKAYNQMSAAEKVQVRYAYLMKATADAQGDFARTSDSYANQVKILKMNLQNLGGEIGSYFLPSLTEAVQGINSFLSDMSQSFVDNGFKGISEAFRAKISEVKDLAVKSINAFTEGLKTEEGKKAFVEAMNTAITNMMENVKTLASALWEVGKALAEAVWVGFTEWWNATFSNFIKGLDNAMNMDATGNVYSQAKTSAGCGTVNIYTQNLSDSQIDYVIKKANVRMGAV